MPQDAFTIKYISKELKSLLSGGKISKITQPEKDLLIFIIYTRNGSVKLEICTAASGCRVNAVQNETPAPKAAAGFCMLLRKHLQNAEVLDVFQVDGERIICFDLLCTSEFERVNMRLYAEIMGKYSNVVLTADGIIAGALKTSAIGENTKRVLFPGAKYKLPEPQQKAAPDDINRLKKAFDGAYGDKAKFISENVKGISYSTALDIVDFYGENLTATDVNRYIFAEQYEPCVTFAEGKPVDFKVRSSAKNKQIYNTLLSAQSAYYAYVCSEKAFINLKRKLQSAVLSACKKLEKRLAIINDRLLECTDMELIKLKGELITANIYAIERGMTSFKAVNYYDENGGEINIVLDKKLSPAENAQRYYKKYSKLKRTLDSVTVQKRETEAKADYLNSVNSHICAAENVLDLEETQEELINCGLIKAESKDGKKAAKVTPYRSFDCGGFKILAGRNNLQNDRLLKSAYADDIWLHTKAYHSSHVIIACCGKTPDGRILQTAAEICAYYSDGREGSKIAVDYTKRKNVKKPPKSAAGFVVYNDYKTLYVTPQKHAELCKE